ncbi:MAG: DNA/RNA non-specific endonuclease [Cyclobacteriaceae bacterium]
MPGRQKNYRRKEKKYKFRAFYYLSGWLVFIFFLSVISVKEFRRFEYRVKSNGSEPSLELEKTNAENEKSIAGFEFNDEPVFSVYMDSLLTNKSFSIPEMNGEGPQNVVDHGYFILSYNETMEQAQWVAYYLSGPELLVKKKRKGNFSEDPHIKTGSSHPEDFRFSGYDRGHLAPVLDFSYSDHAMKKSFYMSNISPQKPGFNRGIWKKLENQVRSWAKEYEMLLIITGPIFDMGETNSRIGKNDVGIPDYFFKIIFDIHPPEYKMITFLLKNEKSDVPLLEYAISVDSLEQFSGFDFFPLLPDSLENRIENNEKFEIWLE